MEFDQQSLDFILPEGERRVEARRGEDLHGGEAAEVPPMVAVRGGSHGGPAVAEVFSAQQTRAVGEYEIVFGEAFLGYLE